MGNSSRNRSCAGPCGDLPGARSAVTVPGKRVAAGSGRVGSSCGRERGAELGGDRQLGGRPAAPQGGWDRQEAKFFFFFLMRALVTFEDHGPKSRGETGFFFPRWRILERRGAEAWGMRWPGRGNSNTGEQSRRRRRGRSVSGKLGGFLPAPHGRLDGGRG